MTVMGLLTVLFYWIRERKIVGNLYAVVVAAEQME